MPLSDTQALRYARQILLEEVEEEGQERLLTSRVLVVGAGGLGVPLAGYLAAAGVGTLGIADGDRVAHTNLHRQIAYAEDDVGQSKTARLARRLKENNSEVSVVSHPRLDSENIDKIVALYDLVADGCDNFPTRYLVNAACVRARKPLVSAALSRFTGELAMFAPGGPCYQCLFPRMPDSNAAQGCVEGGILGPMAGLLGCWQALEVLKQLLGLSSRLENELLVFDGLNQVTRRIRLHKDSACPTCGGNRGEDTVFRATA